MNTFGVDSSLSRVLSKSNKLAKLRRCSSGPDVKKIRTCTLLRGQLRSPQPPRHDKLHIALIAFSQKHLLCLIDCQLSSHSTECRPSFYFRKIAFPLNSVSICFQLLHFPHLIVSSNMSDDLKSIIPDFLGPD